MVRCCAVLMCPLNGQSNWTNKNVLRSLELDSVVSTYVRLSVRHLWAVLIYQFSYSYHGRIFQWAVYITYGNNAVLLGQVAQTCCQTVSHQSRCCILRPAQRGGLFCFRYCPFGVAFVDTITRELVIFFFAYVLFFTFKCTELGAIGPWRAWLTNHRSSVVWHCCLGHVTREIVSEMTYNVSSGTLNSTIPKKRLDLTWPYRDIFWDQDMMISSDDFENICISMHCDAWVGADSPLF